MASKARRRRSEMEAEIDKMERALKQKKEEMAVFVVEDSIENCSKNIHKEIKELDELCVAGGYTDRTPTFISGELYRSKYKGMGRYIIILIFEKR